MILDPQGYSFCFPLLLEELQLRGKDLSSSDVGGGVLLFPGSTSQKDGVLRKLEDCQDPEALASWGLRLG